MVNKANDHVIHSVVSVKVTSDISAQCNASNDMGTEVKDFSIKASKSLFVRRVVDSTDHHQTCKLCCWRKLCSRLMLRCLRFLFHRDNIWLL